MLSKRKMPEYAFSELHMLLRAAKEHMRLGKLEQAFSYFNKACDKFDYVPETHLARAEAYITIGDISKKNSPANGTQENVTAYLNGYLSALQNCYMAIALTPDNLSAHKLRYKILLALRNPAYQELLKISIETHLEINQHDREHNLWEYQAGLDSIAAISKLNMVDAKNKLLELRDKVQKFSNWHQRLIRGLFTQSKQTLVVKLIKSAGINEAQVETIDGYSDEIAECVMLALSANEKGDIAIANYYFEYAYNKFPNDILSLTYTSDLALRDQIKKNIPITESHVDILRAIDKFNFTLLHALNGFAYANAQNYAKASEAYINAFKNYTSEHLDYFNSMQKEIYLSLGKLLPGMDQFITIPDILPKPLAYAKIYEDTAEIHFELGSHDKALLYYSMAIWHEDEKREKPNPKLEHLYRRRSHLFLLKNNFIEANKNLEYALEHASSPNEFYLTSAHDGIERLVKHTRATDDDVPPEIAPGFNEYMRGLRAVELFSKTNYPQIALVILDRLIENYKNFPDAYYQRAKIEKELKLLEDAQGDLLSGLELCPLNREVIAEFLDVSKMLDDHNVKSVKADLVDSHNKGDEFQLYCNVAANRYLKPVTTGVIKPLVVSITFLGYEAFSADKPELANYLFTKSLLKDKRDFIAQTLRGINSFFSPHHSGRYEDFNHCIETYKYGRAFYGRAVLHAKNRNYGEAVKDFINAHNNCIEEDYEFFARINLSPQQILARLDEPRESIKSVATFDFLKHARNKLDKKLPKVAKFYLSAGLMAGDPKLLHQYYAHRSYIHLETDMPLEAKADIDNSIKIATQNNIPNEDITILSSNFTQKCYEYVSSALAKPSAVVTMQYCNLGLAIYPTQELYLQRAIAYTKEKKYESAKNDLATATILATGKNLPIDPRIPALLVEIDRKVNPPPRAPKYQKKKAQKPKALITFPAKKARETTSIAESIVEEKPIPVEVDVEEVKEIKEEPKLVIAISSPASNIARNNRVKKRKERIKAARKVTTSTSVSYDNNSDLEEDKLVANKQTPATNIATPTHKVIVETTLHISAADEKKVFSYTPISYAEIIKRTLPPAPLVEDTSIAEPAIVKETAQVDKPEVVEAMKAEDVEPKVEPVNTEQLVVEVIVSEPVVKAIAPEPVIDVIAPEPVVEVSETKQEEIISIAFPTTSPVATSEPESAHGTPFSSLSESSSTETLTNLDLSQDQIAEPFHLSSKRSIIATTVQDDSAPSSPRSDLLSPEPAPSPANSVEPSPFMETLSSAPLINQLPKLEPASQYQRTSSGNSVGVNEENLAKFNFRNPPQLPVSQSMFFPVAPTQETMFTILLSYIPDYLQLFDIEQEFFKEVFRYEQELNEGINEPQDYVNYKTYINGGSVYDRILAGYVDILNRELPGMDLMLQAKIKRYLNTENLTRQIIIDDIDIVTELPHEAVVKIAEKLGFVAWVSKYTTAQVQHPEGTYVPNIKCLSYTYRKSPEHSPVKFDFVLKTKINLRNEAAIRTNRIFLDEKGRKVDTSGFDIEDMIYGRMRITKQVTDTYLIEPLKLMHLIGQTTKRKLHIHQREALKNCAYDPLPIAPSYTNSGLQKLFCNKSLIINFNKLLEFHFFEHALGEEYGKYLKQDYRWLIIHLQISNEQIYPSLRHIFCFLIATIAMQAVYNQLNDRMANISLRRSHTTEPIFYDALGDYNNAMSNGNLLQVCEHIIDQTQIFASCLRDGKAYSYLLQKNIHDRKARISEIPLPDPNYQNDNDQRQAEVVQRIESRTRPRR